MRQTPKHVEHGQRIGRADRHIDANVAVGEIIMSTLAKHNESPWASKTWKYHYLPWLAQVCKRHLWVRVTGSHLHFPDFGGWLSTRIELEFHHLCLGGLIQNWAVDQPNACVNDLHALWVCACVVYGLWWCRFEISKHQDEVYWSLNNVNQSQENCCFVVWSMHVIWCQSLDLIDRVNLLFWRQNNTSFVSARNIIARDTSTLWTCKHHLDVKFHV